MVLGVFLGCFRVFWGCLEYCMAENMMILPFYGAFQRPILVENSAKSALTVNFGLCVRAILDVFQ